MQQCNCFHMVSRNCTFQVHYAEEREMHAVPSAYILQAMHCVCVRDLCCTPEHVIRRRASEQPPWLKGSGSRGHQAHKIVMPTGKEATGPMINSPVTTDGLFGQALRLYAMKVMAGRGSAPLSIPPG